MVVSNAAGAGPTSGTVTVTETRAGRPDAGLDGGHGLELLGRHLHAQRRAGPGSSYPPITVTVNVAADAPSQVTNQVAVSGGGSAAPAPST